MTKRRTATLSSRGQQRPRQLSLPFQAAEPATPLVEGAQRAVAMALLRQMLVEVVLAESRTNKSDEKKETDHE